MADYEYYIRPRTEPISLYELSLLAFNNTIQFFDDLEAMKKKIPPRILLDLKKTYTPSLIFNQRLLRDRLRRENFMPPSTVPLTANGLYSGKLRVYECIQYVDAFGPPLDDYVYYHKMIMYRRYCQDCWYEYLHARRYTRQKAVQITLSVHFENDTLCV